MKTQKIVFLVLAVICGITLQLKAAEPTQDVKPFSGGSEKFTKLVWADEFDGKGLPDKSKWNYEKGYVRNKELQYYTVERIENAEVCDGHLVITARKDNAVIDGKEHEITSASIHSSKKGDWLYGRFEARIKIPSSTGTWPAFWMMPTNGKYGGWPKSGEIDILEHVGFDPNKLHFNLHTEKYNHVKKSGRGTSITYEHPQADFHVYAVEWFEDHIDWYFDDKKVFTVKNDEPGWEAWPLDQPFHVKLNLAFGGAWGGAKGVDKDSLPLKMIVDYVRIFQ
ncbi:MAG: glycoside hydrolase family 16 protein [Planctomycetaceae bacterium]|jgi:beta-glucanase (GH16 family)|nr:glycoside hydrolase family 16 protein [Planctomycetaceae bacterium]